MQEKKSYLKSQIKARQCRRIMMILQSKETLPSDIHQYNAVYSRYQRDLQSRININTEKIGNNRASMAERDAANARKNNGGQ
jgi:hypothetical protein